MKLFFGLALVFLCGCSYRASVGWDWGSPKSIDQKLAEHDKAMRKLAEDLEFNASISPLR